MEDDYEATDDAPVLSDVHLHTPASSMATSVTERYIASLPRSQIDDDDDDDDAEDLVVQRKRPQKIVIRLSHAMATPLGSVGLQVWRGALLLSDYVLTHQHLFASCGVLELGAGTGLVSIVLGAIGCRVICTDIGDSVLENCKNNMDLNSLAISGNIAVRALDWANPPHLDDSHDVDDPSAPELYEWTSADTEFFHKSVQVIVAADVIYVDEWTDNLVSLLHVLLHFNASGQAREAFVAVERRINFTLDDLDVVSPAFDHFTEICLHNPSFSAERILMDFPRCFEYDRVAELELWRVSLSRNKFE